MGLLRHYLRNELEELGRNGARLRVIGDRDRLAGGHRVATSPMPSGARSPTPGSTSISASTTARATRSCRRPAASPARSRPASWPPRAIDETLFERELLTAGVPDPGPADPHQRRAAHQQFPALAVRLRRAGVRRHAVARFRQGASGTGDRRVPPARTSLWRRRRLGRPRRLQRASAACCFGSCRPRSWARCCLAAVWYGFPWIDLVAALCAPIMIGEWFRLTRRRPIALALAVVYSIAALLALLWLRHQPAYGRETIIWILACVWATDIGAYFIGSFAGGAKLAPSISPSKTWSGLVGGMCFSAVASAACGLRVRCRRDVDAGGDRRSPSPWSAQGGDLLELAAKRRAGVKDSGSLIPGTWRRARPHRRADRRPRIHRAIRLATAGDWPWA